MIISNLAGYFDGRGYHKGPYSIEIKNGVISQISQEERSEGDIDGTGKILSVPFSDGHTHLIFAGNRSFELPYKVRGESYANILKQGGGILTTVKHTQNASDEELKTLVEQRLDIMLQHGTLNIEAKSGYGLTAEQELRLLKVLQAVNQTHPIEITSTYCGAHALPPDQDRFEYVSEVMSIVPEIVSQNLASSQDVFCDDGAFTVDETTKIFDASVKEGLPVRVHAEELKYTGIGKLASEKYQALSVDHLLLARVDDFKIFERNETPIMFMPGATIGLFTNQRPQGWQDLDLTIGLGTDFNPNNLTFSMQTALRLGVYLYRIPPLQAYKAATTGSYKAITGTDYPPLKEGSDATFNILSGESINDVITQFDQNSVLMVFKKGKLLVNNSKISL